MNKPGWKKEAKKRTPRDSAFGFPAFQKRFEDGQDSQKMLSCPSYSQNVPSTPASSQGERINHQNQILSLISSFCGKPTKWLKNGFKVCLSPLASQPLMGGTFEIKPGRLSERSKFLTGLKRPFPQREPAGQDAGGPFFCLLFLGKQKEYGVARGRNPGTPRKKQL